MRVIDRRRFLGVAGLAATSGVVGATFGPRLGARILQEANPPDYVLNPVEVTGEEAIPIVGRLPGARRMYVLPPGVGDHHRIGGQVMTRSARPIDTGSVYELMMFTGRTGASMPRHVHRSSHAAFLVLSGEIELELEGRRWQMMRGDFANIPPGTPHAWTMRSDRSKIALYTMNDRVGSAFVSMGAAHPSDVPSDGAAAPIDPEKLAGAADHGDFQVVPGAASQGEILRVSNKALPTTPGSYVLLDGGGERFGGNVFLARNANTTGNFLFIMTEGGPSAGVPAHFHARHFENFLGMDGETLGWAHGKAASLTSGVYFQAPPRNLHGFRLTQQYNRFAAFLTPGIFESFFTRGGGQPPAAGRGRDGSRGEGRGGNDMFRSLMMSGRGPDGYPLDVHGPTQPLPPQDPVWLQGDAGNTIRQRAALLAHAEAICGIAISREITPELRRALEFKPKAEEFL